MNLSYVVGATSLAVVMASIVPRTAGAQEATPPAVTVRDSTPTATAPTWWLVESGSVLFAFAYAPAVVVGVSSGLGADRALLVPVVGPWIDLTQRPGCKPVASCHSEDSAKALVVVDGIVQAIGALTALGGLVVRTPEATVRVAPAQVGAGYGVVALGTF
jgi:hypothetical protein